MDEHEQNERWMDSTHELDEEEDSDPTLQSIDLAAVTTFMVPPGEKVIIDADDWERVRMFRWRSNGERVQTTIGLHRLVLGYHGDLDVDHINGNYLDNRKENLRVVTTAQNMWNKRRQRNNKSGYVGVNYRGDLSGPNKWRATIAVHGKTRHIGNYPTAQEAARARDAVARELHGVYARLNFPDEVLP